MTTQVGTLLKQERLSKKLHLEDVEKSTHIRMMSLKALEANNWEAFSSRTYASGIVKQYGKFLGLDEEKLLAYFRREYAQHENMRFKEKAPAHTFVSHKRRAIGLAVVIIGILFVAFFGYQTYLYLKPPEIIITSPTETVFKRRDKILLTGTAPAETLITINGRDVYLDEKNRFEADIPLTKARTTVSIVATGANGRKTVVKKVYEKR